MERNENKVYALAGVFGGVAVGGAFVLGSALATATGIPLMPAVVNGFWVGLVMAACSRFLIEYRWTGTAMMFVYGATATFTLLLGPPGWHKIPIAILMGVAWDISLLKSRNIFMYLIASVLFMGVGFALLMLAFWIQKSPAFDKMLAVLPLVVTISIVTMCIGSLIGVVVGNRLSTLPAAQRVIGKG